MQITFSTDNTPGRPNEDYAICGPEWAVVLDGATAPQGVDSGCIHDVPWLVRHLAAGISSRLMLDTLSLPDVLASAIESTCQAHASTCDLHNPDSPSSTVAIIRVRDESLDYLVLGDSPVILRKEDGDLVPVTDDRIENLPGGRPYSIEFVRSMRNKAGGFWIASTDIQAAYHAVSGSATNVADAALVTDGITRLVEWYGHDWPEVFTILDTGGPSALIASVRAAERQSPPSHAKAHDDATAVYANVLSRTGKPPRLWRHDVFANS